MVKVLSLVIIVIRKVTYATIVMLTKEIRKRLCMVILVVMHMQVFLKVPIVMLLMMSSLVKISLGRWIREPVFTFVEM